ncbi:MAG: Mur ligase [Halorhabdus sp.]
MIDQARFEVRRTDEGWIWAFLDGDLPLGVSPVPHDDSRAARAAIDAVRDAVADVEAVTDFEYATDSEDRPGARMRIDGHTDPDIFEWSLEQAGDVLAVPNYTYTSRETAVAAAEHFLELAAGAIPVFLTGTTEPADDYDPFDVGRGPIRGRLRSLLRRGRRHRQFLDSVDIRIVVSGIRGKSSTVRRLDDVFTRRGYDVLTKLTGNRPTLIRNGEAIPIERPGPYTTLYENINVLREFGPVLDSYTPEDVAIFENQGITEYTTRVFNRQLVKPDVVVLANVRQDHQDTLGKTRREIARAFARTIPPGATVVSGERHPILAQYMQEEIEQVGATYRTVSIPEGKGDLIGAETVYAVNDVLDALDMHPVPEAQLEEYLDAIQPTWTRVPGGRIFDGAEINDIESTELIRRALAGDNYILPFVYLRSDRRSRTASFAAYLNTLADRDLIRQARAGGAFTDVFAANVDVPVQTHDPDEDAGAVLDALLAEECPVMLMGNAVDEFMRDMEDEIADRATQVAAAEAD